MFAKALLKPILFCGFMVVSVAAAQDASAAQRYGVTEIVNTAKVAVKYHTKWGPQGKWETHVLAPGKSRLHWWKYDTINQPKSPTLYLHFDDDMSSVTHMRKGTCERYAAPEPSSRYAKKYRFKVDGYSGRYLDLVSTN